MLFPRPVENVWPHSSQVLLFLSMVTVGVEEYITVSCGRRRLTSRSFRFLFLLYAIMGGCGYRSLHFWLECKIGCRLWIFCLRSGIIGLYVVLNIIRSSLSRSSLGLRSSLRFSNEALRTPSFIKPSLKPLFRKRVTSFSQCFLKSVVSEQILLIRKARPYGRLAF